MYPKYPYFGKEEQCKEGPITFPPQRPRPSARYGISFGAAADSGKSSRDGEL